MRDQFLTAIALSLEVDSSVLHERGVTVKGLARRAGHHVTGVYELGEHLVISCDPAIEDMLVEATRTMTPTLAAWKETAAQAGGEPAGGARMQLLGAGLPLVGELRDGFHRKTLHSDSAEDRALIARLIEASVQDELDEADLALDDLDPIIEVLLDEQGHIACYSAARPFDMAPDFADIGIFTRTDCRGVGLGSYLVAALCPVMRHAGLEPLYRCGENNTGSVKLSERLGFEIATQLTGYRFPPHL